MDNNKLIDKFNAVHNNKYNYSLVDYINIRTKIKIICPEHGVFEQRVDSHLKGSGCKKCYVLRKIKTTEQFILYFVWGRTKYYTI